MNHSRQRDRIMDYLRSTKSHPTAEEVYQNVKPVEPDISLGTVYRNLNLLSENGMILKLHMDDGIDHFDADISEHYHFYCEGCGRVSDLDMKLPTTIKKLVKAAADSTKGEVNGCIIYFHGLCEQCVGE